MHRPRKRRETVMFDLVFDGQEYNVLNLKSVPKNNYNLDFDFDLIIFFFLNKCCSSFQL